MTTPLKGSTTSTMLRIKERSYRSLAMAVVTLIVILLIGFRQAVAQQRGFVSPPSITQNQPKPVLELPATYPPGCGSPAPAPSALA